MKRTKGNTGLTMLLAALTLLATMALHASLFLASATLLTACSTDDTNTTSPATNDSEIRFDVGVWNMMEGTRATFYDTGVQNSGSFTCAAFSANSTTSYFGYTTVNWVTDAWVFSDGKHYWPATGSLDFFAYMPASGSLPNYITEGPTYATNHDVTFACSSLPMTHAGQNDDLKEFVYAMTLDQDKAGTNSAAQPTPGQVALTFQHPFTRIKLQLSSTQENIHINSITLKSIKNNGSYSHTSGWTPTSPATNFVATLDADYVANTAIGTYIMVPQTWAGEIEVNADWKVWDVAENHTVSTTVPTTWAAGHSYTYTFTITETDLIVDTSKFTEQW